jgi:hypothetical protein
MAQINIILIGFSKKIYDKSIENLTYPMCERLVFLDNENTLKISVTGEGELEESYGHFGEEYIVRAFFNKC